MAATKSQSVDFLLSLTEVGLSDFGESYVGEFKQKFSEYFEKFSRLGPKSAESGANPKWHFIGQLQSNKVRELKGQEIALFQSVDREGLITALTKYFPQNEILIQLDTTGDPKRGGADQNEVPRLLELADTAGLKPVGIMLIARIGIKERLEDFRLAKRLQEKLGLEILSAGMSDDFEVAVGEGSNMLRLGRILQA